MSACLFMLNTATIRNMSDEDLERSIDKWTQYAAMTTTNFQQDRAFGSQCNLNWAKAELYVRKALGKDFAELLPALLQREGLFDHPALCMAWTDMVVFGEGRLILRENKIEYDKRNEQLDGKN